MRRIMVGFRCNNSCIFCAQGSLRNGVPPGDSPLIQLTRKAVQANDFDGAAAFVGGEPTIDDSLVDAVREAKFLGAKWTLVQTNGRRFAYRAYCDSLVEAGLDAADISLHGSTASMHDYHTSVAGSWGQTVLGIRNARRAGIQVGVTIVITRSNFRHLEDIVTLAHHQGAKAIHLELAASIGHAGANWARVVPSGEMAFPFLASAVKAARTKRLEVLTCNQATSGAARFFAGIGETEPATAAIVQTQNETRASAPPSRRPAPGAREVRGAQKKTGDALRKLFPGIFEERSGVSEMQIG